MEMGFGRLLRVFFQPIKYKSIVRLHNGSAYQQVWKKDSIFRKNFTEICFETSIYASFEPIWLTESFSYYLIIDFIPKPAFVLAYSTLGTSQYFIDFAILHICEENNKS